MSDYDFRRNTHSAEGPVPLVDWILANLAPASVLDAGCGQGVWLRCFAAKGLADFLGIDGADLAPDELLIDASHFRRIDLRKQWSLGRRFDVALCLEVAEHLPEESAECLITSLGEHCDQVVFSAACPRQPGDHHLNCQWPGFWQRRFNNAGFVCSDPLRPLFWECAQIEPWYRQNIFLARRSSGAGEEPRLQRLVHPEVAAMIEFSGREKGRADMADGNLPVRRMLGDPLKGIVNKAARFLVPSAAARPPSQTADPR